MDETSSLMPTRKLCLRYTQRAWWQQIHEYSLLFNSFLNLGFVIFIFCRYSEGVAGKLCYKSNQICVLLYKSHKGAGDSVCCGLFFNFLSASVSTSANYLAYQSSILPHLFLSSCYHCPYNICCFVTTRIVNRAFCAWTLMFYLLRGATALQM